jgi:hypothetical protein
MHLGGRDVLPDLSEIPKWAAVKRAAIYDDDHAKLLERGLGLVSEKDWALELQLVLVLELTLGWN